MNSLANETVAGGDELIALDESAQEAVTAGVAPLAVLAAGAFVGGLALGAITKGVQIAVKKLLP